jgi:hypothetical protein
VRQNEEGRGVIGKVKERIGFGGKIDKRMGGEKGGQQKEREEIGGWLEGER